MKKLFLYIFIILLLSAAALSAGDMSSVCFNYQGNALYFLQNPALGSHSEVVVTDLNSDIEIEVTLDSVAKPCLSWGEQVMGYSKAQLQRIA